MDIQLVFGDEFWTRLDELTKTAKRRIFLFSAYIGKKEWDSVIASKKKDVPLISMCRSDSGFKPDVDTFIVDKNLYHGKLYVVDNIVLLGSQNLYNANKKGEFSVEFQASNEHEASLIVYQALLKTFDGQCPSEEPVNESFLDFYGDCCPFCGGAPADPLSVIRCAEYGGGFVSEEDCGSYGDEGACKYCIPENRKNLGECYVCDHSGCGFGVQLNSRKLIYHTFVEQDNIAISNAKKYIQLFNFFAEFDPQFAIKLFRTLGFTGNIFNACTERLYWQCGG